MELKRKVKELEEEDAKQRLQQFSHGLAGTTRVLFTLYHSPTEYHYRSLVSCVPHLRSSLLGGDPRQLKNRTGTRNALTTLQSRAVDRISLRS